MTASFAWTMPDWDAQPDSIRLAFHVAVSGFHLADHYCRYHQRQVPAFARKYPEKNDQGLKDFQEALKRKTPAFKVIQDMRAGLGNLHRPLSGVSA
jgi:hypothetical protein